MSDLADGSDETLVALLDLGITLEAVLDDLQNPETLNLTSLKTPACETEKNDLFHFQWVFLWLG
jgi:hypothetical protein